MQPASLQLVTVEREEQGERVMLSTKYKEQTGRGYRWGNLKKDVRGRLDFLLEKDAKRSVLLFQVEDAGPELQTLLPQILLAQNREGAGSE